MKTRKIGIFTLGLTLIVFGSLFLLHTIMVPISYELILKLWPFMFLFLGVEILLQYFRKKEEALSLDGVSVVLLILLTCFAMAMAFMDLAFTYWQNNQPLIF